MTRFHGLLLVAPLLLWYLLFNWLFGTDALIGDSERYLQYAKGLIHGGYTDPTNPSFRNGPGYPIYLVPFVVLDSSVTTIRFSNAVWLFFGVFSFFKLLNLYLPTNKALLWTYLLGLLPTFFRHSGMLWSEPLAIALTCGFMYFLARYLKNPRHSWKLGVLAGVSLGLLILTKVVVAYAVVACVFAVGVLTIFVRYVQALRLLAVLVLGAIICLPYLSYTYSVTGKPFVLGTIGGELLYWRSTPFEEEKGNWIDTRQLLQERDAGEPSDIYRRHEAVLLEIEKLSYLEQDERFKELAMQNMIEHPTAYLRKTVASLSRLFLNTPSTNVDQGIRNILYWPNIVLGLGFLLCSLVCLLKIRLVPLEVLFSFVFAGILIAGLTLLSGRIRHLAPILPFMVFVQAYVWHHFLELRLSSGNQADRSSTN
ncbi:MAG: glycosyltransferase family 39 protein [Pseudomonadota bacterium]